MSKTWNSMIRWDLCSNNLRCLSVVLQNIGSILGSVGGHISVWLQMLKTIWPNWHQLCASRWQASRATHCQWRRGWVLILSKVPDHPWFLWMGKALASNISDRFLSSQETTFGMMSSSAPCFPQQHADCTWRVLGWGKETSIYWSSTICQSLWNVDDYMEDYINDVH